MRGKYKLVLDILRNNELKSRPEMVQLISKELDIPENSANTYYYKALKELGLTPPKVKRGRKPGTTTRPFRKKARHFLKWRKKKLNPTKKKFDYKDYNEYDPEPDDLFQIIRIQQD